jgi:hypothetical protein
MKLSRPINYYADDCCPQVFAAGVQRATSAFGDEPRRMLRIIQRFGNLQGIFRANA